ncbi:MAG: hypothetical protein LBR08_11775 [Bacteroidales bacterium]|jgi:hypothetical protein|nr:hypothetical protein [Bacteroidales bacterium]
MLKNDVLYWVLLFFVVSSVSCKKENDNEENSGSQLHVRVMGDRTKYLDLHALNDTVLMLHIGYTQDNVHDHDVALTVAEDSFYTKTKENMKKYPKVYIR